MKAGDCDEASLLMPEDSFIDEVWPLFKPVIPLFNNEEVDVLTGVCFAFCAAERVGVGPYVLIEVCFGLVKSQIKRRRSKRKIEATAITIPMIFSFFIIILCKLPFYRLSRAILHKVFGLPPYSHYKYDNYLYPAYIGSI